MTDTDKLIPVPEATLREMRQQAIGRLRLVSTIDALLLPPVPSCTHPSLSWQVHGANRFILGPGVVRGNCVDCGALVPVTWGEPTPQPTAWDSVCYCTPTEISPSCMTVSHREELWYNRVKGLEAKQPTEALRLAREALTLDTVRARLAERPDGERPYCSACAEWLPQHLPSCKIAAALKALENAGT